MCKLHKDDDFFFFFFPGMINYPFEHLCNLKLLVQVSGLQTCEVMVLVKMIVEWPPGMNY